MTEAATLPSSLPTPAPDRRAVTAPSHAFQPSFEALGAPLHEVTFVVFDLETTGGNAQRDRVTEIGAVKVRGGDRIGQFATLVHPGRSIPREITALTGITDAMVAGHPPIQSVLPTFLEFVDGAVLVAHSARFDVGFINAACEQHGYARLDNPVIDTVALARRLVRDEVRNLKLATLATHLRARVRPTHRALADAQATVDVLHALIERAGSVGAMTLPDLQHLCTVRSLPNFRKIDLVADAPRRPGVYRFLDERGTVLYIGKATDLRARLRTYFGQDPRRRIDEMVRRATRVTWTETATELEAAVMEVRAIAAHAPPYNRRSKNPQRRVWVTLTKEAFPRLSTTPHPGVGRAALLGPVPRRTATRVIAALMEAHALRECTQRLRVRQDHPPCALKELGRCPAPCDGTMSRDDHDLLVREAQDAIAVDPTASLRVLAERMHDAATDQQFERAARLRDHVATLARAVTIHRGATALAATALVVATRVVEDAESGHAVEVVALRHGRLAGSWRVPDLTAARRMQVATQDVFAVPDLLVHATEAEELSLVQAWLAAPRTRLLRVEGTWAHPVAGSAVLAHVERRHRAAMRRHDRETRHLRRRGTHNGSTPTPAPTPASVSPRRRRATPTATGTPRGLGTPVGARTGEPGSAGGT